MGEKSRDDRPGITDEGVARLRARIGIAEPHPQPPHYERPNEDAFRHVANAYGDDNPLYCDTDYAARTRWGSVIAPPLLVGGDTLIGVDEVPEVDEAHREQMRGDPLRGVHAFYSGSCHEWWQPLLPGPTACAGATRWSAVQRQGRASSPKSRRFTSGPPRSSEDDAGSVCSRVSTV